MSRRRSIKGANSGSLLSVIATTSALFFLSLIFIIASAEKTAGLSSNSNPSHSSVVFRSIVVTGGNKGQGFALCERILSEHDDTHVFLCSRDTVKGEDAVKKLSSRFGNHRINLIQLDVTNEQTIQLAYEKVKEHLRSNKMEGGDNDNTKERYLHGLVSNAGILWGHNLKELFDVCTIGVQRVLDTFLPLMDPINGRIIVVSSGLGPLMHGYASKENQKILKDDIINTSWETLLNMMEQCLKAEAETKAAAEKQEQNEEAEQVEEMNSSFEKIGFPGGPFEVAVPDFHMYGLAKMFADSYMLKLSKLYPNVKVYSCDPGLVYTDLITKMPKYSGMNAEETGAKTPQQGVEVTMRLLFDNDSNGNGDGKSRTPLRESGKFYAMSKDGSKLMSSTIDKMPNK